MKTATKIVSKTKIQDEDICEKCNQKSFIKTRDERLNQVFLEKYSWTKTHNSSVFSKFQNCPSFNLSQMTSNIIHVCNDMSILSSNEILPTFIDAKTYKDVL